MPAPPSISALSSGSGAALERPNIRAALPAGVGGNDRAPRPVALARARPHHRPQAGARFVDQPFERHLAAGDDRDALAQALGVGDHVGREDDGRAGCGARLDQPSSLPWLIGSSPERLVEHDQAGLVDEGAEQLDGLRHAFGKVADELFRPVGDAALGQQGLGPGGALRRWAGRAALP